MYISMYDFKVMNETTNNIKPILTYILDLLTKKGVTCNLSTKGDTIRISKNKDGKLFSSSVKNIIPLAEGDGRIEKLGRNYLESERVTEKQFQWVKDVLSKELTNTLISCDIKLYKTGTEEDLGIDFRKGMVDYLERWDEVSPTTFPVERT